MYIRARHVLITALREIKRSLTVMNWKRLSPWIYTRTSRKILSNVYLSEDRSLCSRWVYRVNFFVCLLTAKVYTSEAKTRQKISRLKYFSNVKAKEIKSCRLTTARLDLLTRGRRKIKSMKIGQSLASKASPNTLLSWDPWALAFIHGVGE